MTSHLVDRLAAVDRLVADLPAWTRLEEHAHSMSHDLVIVGDEDLQGRHEALGSTSISTWTVEPLSLDSMRSCPPSCRTLSRIPKSPTRRDRTASCRSACRPTSLVPGHAPRGPRRADGARAESAP